MFRVKISNFIKKNIYKIQDLATKLLIVAIIVFIATIMLSSFKRNSDDKEKKEELYNPKETVIKGSSISEKQYQADKTLVDKFLEYCNKGQIEEAYDLLSKQCKDNIYHTIEIFKENYYDNIFNMQKEYNLQAWISTNKYTVYKIRYNNNILATGEYDKDEIYQDYITLIKNQDREEISIGSFVISETVEKNNKTEGIESKVTKINRYVEDEEYEINITNNTQHTILLDVLENSDNIKLVSEVGSTYQTYISKILKSELMIKSGQTKRIIIRFKKSLSNLNRSKYIEFYRVIRDYEKYREDKENYTDIIDLRINV